MNKCALFDTDFISKLHITRKDDENRLIDRVILKERLHLERSEAKQYFDSWMQLHQASHQTAFKIHRNTKEMQLMNMDGYEIFDRIYNGTMTILKNGNLKLRE